MKEGKIVYHLGDLAESYFIEIEDKTDIINNILISIQLLDLHFKEKVKNFTFRKVEKYDDKITILQKTQLKRSFLTKWL